MLPHFPFPYLIPVFRTKYFRKALLFAYVEKGYIQGNAVRPRGEKNDDDDSDDD